MLHQTDGGQRGGALSAPGSGSNTAMLSFVQKIQTSHRQRLAVLARS